MEIKRYKINYVSWKCITKKRFFQERIDDKNFNGYVGLVIIDEVSQFQEWEIAGENLIVCDKGYTWLVFIPDNQNCCITAMMTSDKKILLWYIDIIENLELGRDCILEYDDLFLDFIVMPDGLVYEEDRVELMEAYREKVITHKQFVLVKQVVDSMKREGYLDNERLLYLTRYLFNKMVEKY